MVFSRFSVVLSLSIALLTGFSSIVQPAIAEESKSINSKESVNDQTVIQSMQLKLSIKKIIELYKKETPESLRLALPEAEKALQLSRANKDRESEANVLFLKAKIHGDLDENRKALELLQQAIPIVRELNDREQTGLILNAMGSIYGSLGDSRKALEVLEQALVIRRELKDRRGESNTLNNIARAYSQLGDRKKALEIDLQVLPIRREIKHRKGEAVTLNNIALDYYYLDELAKALDFFNQSLPIRREVKDRDGEATVLTNMGGVYNSLGNQKQALDLYQQALTIRREIGDRDGEANSLNNIGHLFSGLGEKRRALEFYEKSLKIRQELENKFDEAGSLNNIGSMYSSLKQPEKAAEFYERALTIRRLIGDRDGEATTLNNIGSLYLDGKEYAKSLDFLNQALPIFQQINKRSDEATVLSNIGVIFEKQSQPELAIVFYKRSVNLYESIRANNQKLSPELLKSYITSFSKTYDRLSQLLIKQGRLPEAQAVLELFKLRELRDYTRDNQAQAVRGISLSVAEQTAFDDIVKQYKTVNQFATTIATCEQTRCDQLTKLRDQRDQLNTSIRSALDRLRITLSNQVIDLGKLNTNEFTSKAKEIVNAKSGTVLIYPIVQEKQVQFLLAFKAGQGENGAVTFRSINSEQLENTNLFQTVQEFRSQLSNPRSDLQELQATSQKLYNWLIKPLESEINQPNIKHLVFASDKATRYIPLGALYDGQEYLVNKPYTITTILAASETQPRSPRPESPNVLAVGASTFKAASDLPYVQQELNAIVQSPSNPKGIFPGKQAFNNQFSFSTLKDQLSNHNFLHIATHGTLDPGNVDNSYLLPGQGENITKDRIATLRDYGLGNIHLVVLSACNTAVGTSANSNDINAAGLELSGISYHFMKGSDGAKSVLASLWAVSDPSTALMMQQFYRYLSQGKTKAEAIQFAQRDLLKVTSESATKTAIESLPRFTPINNDIQFEKMLDRNPLAAGYSHPYYWAPFILIGNSQ